MSNSVLPRPTRPHRSETDVVLGHTRDEARGVTVKHVEQVMGTKQRNGVVLETRLKFEGRGSSHRDTGRDTPCGGS